MGYFKLDKEGKIKTNKKGEIRIFTKKITSFGVLAGGLTAGAGNKTNHEGCPHVGGEGLVNPKAFKKLDALEKKNRYRNPFTNGSLSENTYHRSW